MKVKDFIFGHALYWITKRFGYGTHKLNIIPSDSIRPSIHFIMQHLENKNLVGAEIGVARGYNAINILKNLDIHTLYLIDPWEGCVDYEENGHFTNDYNITMKNLSPYNNVRIIRDYSDKASFCIDNSSLDFVYIDGNHAYSYVITDLRNYWPKIRKGGILAGHDIYLSEVFQAVMDFSNEIGVDYNVHSPDFWFIKDRVAQERCSSPFFKRWRGLRKWLLRKLLTASWLHSLTSARLLVYLSNDDKR